MKTLFSLRIQPNLDNLNHALFYLTSRTKIKQQLTLMEEWLCGGHYKYYHLNSWCYGTTRCLKTAECHHFCGSVNVTEEHRDICQSPPQGKDQCDKNFLEKNLHTKYAKINALHYNNTILLNPLIDKGLWGTIFLMSLTKTCRFSAKPLHDQLWKTSQTLDIWIF